MTLTKSMQKYFRLKKSPDNDDGIITPVTRGVPPPASRAQVPSAPEVDPGDPGPSENPGHVVRRRSDGSFGRPNPIDPRGNISTDRYSSEVQERLAAATSSEERAAILAESDPNAFRVAQARAARTSSAEPRVVTRPRAVGAQSWIPAWQKALKEKAGQVREIIERVGTDVSQGQHLYDAFAEGSTPENFNEYWSGLYRDSAEQLKSGPKVGGLMIASHGNHVMKKLSEDIFHPIFSALDDGTPIEEIFGSTADETMERVHALKSHYGDGHGSRYGDLTKDKNLQTRLGLNDQLFKYLAGFPAEQNGRPTYPIFGQGSSRVNNATRNSSLFGQGNPNLLGRIKALTEHVGN